MSASLNSPATRILNGARQSQAMSLGVSVAGYMLTSRIGQDYHNIAA